jgi:hypothetical protein
MDLLSPLNIPLVSVNVGTTIALTIGKSLKQAPDGRGCRRAMEGNIVPPTFRNLTGNNLQTAKNAFDTAKRVLTIAGTRLGSNIANDNKMVRLLNDAFGITPNHWLDGTAAVAAITIKGVLAKLAGYFENGTFIYIWNPPPNAQGFAAYSQTNPRRPEVFLTDPFFTRNTRRERAGLLVHEYVHLHHYSAGHPGSQGEQLSVVFGRAPLGIPPNQSVNNAYCYQYFVQWFAADYGIP